MTKPTRRPRGRPKKPKVVSRGRGRPSIALARDPDRYFLALVQSNIDAARSHGISERRVTETYASIRYGFPNRSRENMEALARDERVQVVFDKQRHQLRGSVARGKGQGWLNQNAFRPYADGLRNKLGKLRRKPPSDFDRRWLAAMSIAWRISLLGDLRIKTHAEALAAIVGEREYFSSTMLPILYDSFHRATSPGAAHRKLSDFLHVLIPTFVRKKCD